MVRRISLATLAAVAFGFTGAVLADPPTLSVHPKAPMVAAVDNMAPAIVVYLDVYCGAPPVDAKVTVAVRQGDVESSGPVTYVPDAGTRQTIGVTLPGAWQQGQAVAFATMLCGALPEAFETGAFINITPP